MHDLLPHGRLAQHFVEQFLALAGGQRGAIAIVGVVHVLERGDDVGVEPLTTCIVFRVAKIRCREVRIDLVAVRFFHPVETVHMPATDLVGEVVHRR